MDGIGDACDACPEEFSNQFQGIIGRFGIAQPDDFVGVSFIYSLGDEDGSRYVDENDQLGDNGSLAHHSDGSGPGDLGDRIADHCDNCPF